MSDKFNTRKESNGKQKNKKFKAEIDNVSANFDMSKGRIDLKHSNNTSDAFSTKVVDGVDDSLGDAPSKTASEIKEEIKKTDVLKTDPIPQINPLEKPKEVFAFNIVCQLCGKTYNCRNLKSIASDIVWHYCPPKNKEHPIYKGQCVECKQFFTAEDSISLLEALKPHNHSNITEKSK